MTAVQSLYNGFLGRVADLGGGVDVVVLLVGPGYVFDPAHVYIADLSDEIADAGYTRFATTSDTVLGSGTLRASFDANPSFDTTAVTTVGGWVVALDTGDDATAELVVFVEDPEGDSPANPYIINAGSGFVSATRPSGGVTSVNGLTGDVLLGPQHLLDTDQSDTSTPGYVLTVNDDGDGYIWAEGTGGSSATVDPRSVLATATWRVSPDLNLTDTVQDLAGSNDATGGPAAQITQEPAVLLGCPPLPDPPDVEAVLMCAKPGDFTNGIAIRVDGILNDMQPNDYAEFVTQPNGTGWNNIDEGGTGNNWDNFELAPNWNGVTRDPWWFFQWTEEGGSTDLDHVINYDGGDSPSIPVVLEQRFHILFTILFDNGASGHDISFWRIADKFETEDATIGGRRWAQVATETRSGVTSIDSTPTYNWGVGKAHERITLYGVDIGDFDGDITVMASIDPADQVGPQALDDQQGNEWRAYTAYHGGGNTDPAIRSCSFVGDAGGSVWRGQVIEAPHAPEIDFGLDAHGWSLLIPRLSVGQFNPNDPEVIFSKMDRTGIDPPDFPAGIALVDLTSLFGVVVAVVSDGTDYQASPVPMIAGKVHSFRMELDDSTATAWLDGVQVLSLDISALDPINNTEPLQVGGPCTFGDVIVFDRILTLAELATIDSELR